MSKNHPKRCPHCGCLDVIKKGKRSGHTRYYCKSCGRYFTDRRTSVSLKNKEVWFREWIIDKQTIEQLASRSNYSVRHLKSYFYQMLTHCPVWHIQHREKVNLLIDGTYFPNKVCLVLYRDVNIHMTLYYRLTSGERFWELQQDLRAIKALQIQIESVTCDGGSAILKAVQEVCPEAILQRCTVHIAREIETWITRKPKSQAARELLKLVHLLGRVEDHSEVQLWMRAFIDRYWNWEAFINAKSIDEASGRWWFTHRMLHRSATHIKRAFPDMLAGMTGDWITEKQVGREKIRTIALFHFEWQQYRGVFQPLCTDKDC